MSKISELSDGGALQSTDYLIAVRSGGNVKVQPNGTVTGTTGSFSGNVTFADNAKAIFGAGSDLQIYHDGSNSYIREIGTGDLIVRATNLQLQRVDGAENYLTATQNGAVDVYCDGAVKLSTTLTGIDVTGTVTADGLTVDGDVSLTASGTERFSINREVSPDIQYKIATNNYHLALEAVGASQGDIKFATGTSSASDRMLIASNGDLSLYEDTGTTPKFFWDASAERLGLGTTSPSTQLHLASASGPELRIENTDTALTEGQVVGALTFEQNDATGGGQGITGRIQMRSSARIDSGAYFSNVADMDFLVSGDATGVASDNATKTAMTIRAGGNVGIGTSSPDTLMELRAANPVLTIRDTETSTASNDARLRLAETGVSDALGNYYDIGYIQGNLQFRYNTSEYMRLDASGNLLVGQSSTTTPGIGNTTLGSAILSGGLAAFSRAGGAANATLYVNKNTDDGPIVRFSKDGTQVGSIGVENSNRLYIDSGSGNTGIRFDGGAWIPRDNGVVSDGGVDIGALSARIKDLYLSGGVYLGGTGAANHLDDYEEGTWTPVLSDGTNNATTSAAEGTYTKVGRQVTLSGRFAVSSLGSVSGGVRITGMPFAVLSGNAGRGSLNVSFASGLSLGAAGYSIIGSPSPGNTYTFLGLWDGTAGSSDLLASELTASATLFFSIVYFTA